MREGGVGSDVVYPLLPSMLFIPLRGLGPGPSAATKGGEEDAEREKRVISRLGPHVDLAHCLLLPSFFFSPFPLSSPAYGGGGRITSRLRSRGSIHPGVLGKSRSFWGRDDAINDL